MKKLIVILPCLLLSNLWAQVHPFGKAQWLSPGFIEDSIIRPCPIFTKTFQLTTGIRSAKLYITVHGLYEATINGKRVGKSYFTPGFTDYHQRLQYQVYNVTGLLKKTNTIRVTVADGWYRGVFNEELQCNTFGKDASLLLQLEISYADGSKQIIISDSTWSSTTGPVRYSDLYNGEVQDTRPTIGKRYPVKVAGYTKTNLVPSISQPVTRHESFTPVKIWFTPKEEQVVDFGQNMAGWVMFSVNGKAGDTVKVAHAESLDKDGNFYTGNLRDAKAEDVYILRGGKQILEPHFTYHGFRYIKVSGLKPARDNCKAIALYTDLTKTGTFLCSNPLINRLQKNIEWSLNSNFFDIPTDCPQRSERLGWTGDAQVFCRTAAFNRDVLGFYRKWLADLSADQGANGGMPVVVPRLNRKNDYGVAGWGDAATIIPWTLYEVYGDKEVLNEQYPSMKKWVDYIVSTLDSSFTWKNKGYGDWYAPGPKTDITYIDQCFFVHSTDLLVKTAKVLDRAEDARRYGAVFTRAKAAFLELYKNPGGRTQNTQTAEVLALQFDLLPEKLCQAAADHLALLIHQNNDHLATGFLGTPYLLDVLSRYGHKDLAYTLLSQKTMPSWLYPITKGATTIWEKWDAIRPDGSMDTCSLNHYAYGAVGNWLYLHVGGIRPLAPGYQKVLICPEPGGGLAWAKTTYKCVYGPIICNWKLQGRYFFLYMKIPEGVSATVNVPGALHKKDLKAGVYHWKIRYRQAKA